ncbi:MAG TPA: S1C family serine protease [Verrucomicrobiae bacterium]
MLGEIEKPILAHPCGALYRPTAEKQIPTSKRRRWAVLFIALGLAASKADETARHVASATFPSVALLLMEDDRGQPIALGSGFFVRKKIIVSNFHVVEGAAGGYVKVVGQTAKHRIKGLVGLDAKRDLVALYVEDADAPPLRLGGGSNAAIGDTVFAVGNPQGLEGTFSQGIISGIRDFEKGTLLQITAPISPGSSGGPVLGLDGKVLGVAVATLKTGQNLNFAIPAQYVEELLGGLGTVKPFSAKAGKTSKSFFSDFGGNKATEGVTAGNFTYDSTGRQDGKFSFSLSNQLREPVRNVYCLLVFYDVNWEKTNANLARKRYDPFDHVPDSVYVSGAPIDTCVLRYEGIIPPSGAKRVTGAVDGSVEKLNCPQHTIFVSQPPRSPKGKVEFRVLNFDAAE